MLRRVTTSPATSAAAGQTRSYAAAQIKKTERFKKTRALGFKLKKAAPQEKKKISGNALVKPFRDTVHNAAKMSLTSDLPAIDVETLKSTEPVVLAYQNNVAKTCSVGAVFSPKRGFELLGERTTLLRKESRDLFAAIDANKSKIVLAGPANAGKRELLAQSMAYAEAHGWIVLPSPQLLKYINGTSDYSITESGRLDLLRRNCEFLRKLVAMNPQLKEAKLSQEYAFGQSKFSTDQSISDLAKHGITARFQAGAIFDAVIAEMGKLNQKVLQPVYEVDILARPTEYRTPEFKQIMAKDLQLTQLIKNPPKNFVQVMTTGRSNETAVALGTKNAEDFVYESQFDQSLVDHVKDGEVIEVKAASAAESAVLMEYYQSRGLTVEERGKLHVTSGGLLGELWRQVRAY